MPISNPKNTKRRKQSMRQGTGARRMGKQAYRFGKGPKGKKERQQSRCGTPGRKNARSANGEARSWENDDKTFGLEKSQEGEMPERFESRVQLRSQRRRQRHQSRTS